MLMLFLGEVHAHAENFIIAGTAGGKVSPAAVLPKRCCASQYVSRPFPNTHSPTPTLPPPPRFT
jgi:hypothetical protein